MIRWSFVSQNLRGVCASHLPGQILGYAYTIFRLVKFQFLEQFPVDHLVPPVMSGLILFLYKIAAFYHSDVYYFEMYSFICNFWMNEIGDKNYVQRVTKAGYWMQIEFIKAVMISGGSFIELYFH